MAPGVIDTPLVESLGDSQSVHDALLSRTALKRIGQPEEVSNLISFLLSDQASYITSTVSANDRSIKTSLRETHS